MFAFASLVKTSFLFEHRGERGGLGVTVSFRKRFTLVISFFTLYKNCLWQVGVDSIRFSFWFSFVQRGKV